MMSRISGTQTFFIIWIGQVVSILGTGLTGFVLGIRVYQQTGSATQFTFISVCTLIPAVILSPLTGVLVDRYDRRWVMILSDTGAGLSTLCIALLLWYDALTVWAIYLLMAISSFFSAFQWPAWSASTTLLVPKQYLGRTSGLIQFARSALHLSPILGASLLHVMSLAEVIMLDVLSCLVAVGTLLLVRLPPPPLSKTNLENRRSVWKDIRYGWTYITSRRGLFGLLSFFAINNLLLYIAAALSTPFLLTFTSAQTLGLILSMGGVGLILGTIAMSIWGGPRQRVHGVFGWTLLRCLSIFAMGVAPSVILCAVAFGLFYFSLPIVNGCSQVIWQRKVEPEVQGRVFSIRRAMAFILLPVAHGVAGPLADHFFEPLLTSDGPLASIMGPFVGIGPGHGIRLLYCMMGLLAIAETIGCYLYPRIRYIETELPDAIPG